MAPLAQKPLIVLQPDGVEIPAGIQDLQGFRAWVHSPDFPEGGRIDWIAGRLEVDMSPEDLNSHGTPKSAIAFQLLNKIQETGKGFVFIDRTRFSSLTADISVEPDILVLLLKTLESGEARLVPRASGEPKRYIEIEGRVDLVVECLSDGSAAKDRKLLRLTYHQAGVPEYWLVDARKEEVSFQLLLRRPSGYEEAPRDAAGFARSEVLGEKVRLSRVRKAAGLVLYRLEIGEPS